MADEGKKYGGPARGLWRKVYGYQNAKPQFVEVVDILTATTKSVDLNKTIRFRDFYIIEGITTGFERTIVVPSNLSEYDEGVIFVNTIADDYIGNYNFTFSANPIVVLSIESSALYGANLDVFGLTTTNNGFNFSFSSAFSGSIRYRAINALSYPAFVTSSFTASMTASAGIASPGGLSYYTASFATLSATPFYFAQTVWTNGTNVTLGASVGIFPETSSSSDATSNFSSELSNTVHYIAFT